MKNRRALLLFCLAIGVGSVAAVLIQRVLNEQRPDLVGPKIDTTPVVVAKADLGLASELSTTQLDVVDWPTQFLPQGSFSKPKDLTGRVLRHAIAKGETIQELALLPDGSEGGLASVIAENKRAISVEVDPIIGVAGFVRATGA